MRASAFGSMWRDASHGQVTRTRIVAETLVELLDVGQHAHRRMVRSGGARMRSFIVPVDDEAEGAVRITAPSGDG
jgi:1,6-anhydro-N-acetylmuramate kinase